MRILQIRFKNLNSLVGEWSIDLTHPAYRSDGIFAITGATGAGKTTILDAICLALYGRTPRLNKVTKSENEIMSRQTGECFAEIAFETQSGRYRCHWSQTRARKKADGALQPPKHEIVDMDSDKVLDAKLRGVADQIELATGMNFDRFTRSMLLAQGGFAAFLQAAPDERAPILEQITGTEIYSQISIGVHERRANERKKLDTLQAVLAGMQFMHDEEEQLLKINIEQKIAEEINLNQQISQCRQAIDWLDRVTTLNKDLITLEAQKQTLFERYQAFQPDLKKLERANQCMELAADHAYLDSLRREQDASRQRLNDCARALPEQEVQVKQAEEKLSLNIRHLEQLRTEHKAVLPVIQKVRELDIKRLEKDPLIKSATITFTELENSLSTLRLSNIDHSRELDIKKKDLANLEALLIKHQVNEGLVEHLAGIKSRFELICGLDKKVSYKASLLHSAEIQREQAFQSWLEQSTYLSEKRKQVEASQHHFQEHQQVLNKRLTGRTIADWRDAHKVISERLNCLNKTIESVQKVAESRQMLDSLNVRYESFTIQNDQVARQIEEQEMKHATLEREIGLLETQLLLIKRIHDLDEARHQLKDDEPCPLCGAKEHPFASGNIPPLDDTNTALTRAKEILKQSNNLLSELKIKQAETMKDLAQLMRDQTTLNANITNEQIRINEGLNLLSVIDSGQAVEALLQRLLDETVNELEHVTKIVSAVDEHDKNVNQLRESLETDKEILIQLERDTQGFLHKKESSEQAVAREKIEYEAIAAELKQALDDALQEVSSYGIQQLSSDLLEQLQLELSARREQWLTWQQQKRELDACISKLVLQAQHQSEQISQRETALELQSVSLNDLVQERDRLNHERALLFGDKSPSQEEERLSTAIEAANHRHEDARQLLSSVSQTFAQLKHSIQDIEHTMTIRDVQLKKVNERFQHRLTEFGFTDEPSYLAAALTENERKQLIQQEQQLASENTGLESRIEDKVAQLKIENEKQITDKPREMLAQELNGLMTLQREMQHEIGGIRQKLVENEALARKHKERLIAIEAQKIEYSRWDKLHDLIGSLDGKKYRNFAQGLTFEMMIGHANRQLQKMTDRYLLIRDETQPLELNVIDSYQAGEIRSTKNLSGGEGFIVSLSLALGLSHMASKNVRVDSLFLDEGFGTLDEDALDIALETLAGLQEDGKLIGVISHVPTLKERINTQIQVTHQAGGHSVINGPGCEQKHPAKNS